MFISWRAREAKRAAAGRRPVGLRCRPAIEILEDRCVLSTPADPLAPPMAQAPALSPPSLVNMNGITAVAGQPFLGVVATLTSGDTAPRSAAIIWGDGHTSPGTFAALTSGYAILGSNLYVSPGTYPLSVKVVTAAGDSLVVQGLATVLPGSPILVQGLATILSGSLNLVPRPD